MSKRGTSAVVFDLWGQRGSYRVNVAGEYYHMRDIKRLFTRGVPASGASIVTQVQLVPEPTNRHDRGAVKVMVGSAHIGYLPKEIARLYLPVVKALISTGYAPQCGAQVRAWHSNELEASVRLDLSEPHLLVPLNAAPPGASVILPIGHAVQVTGEDQHMSTLGAWTRPAGEGWVHVSLHTITEGLARSTREIVEVRLEGERVGQLAPKMSGEYLPVIDLLERDSLQTIARAIVKGNRLKADVVLYAAKAGELDERWLQDSARAAAIGASASASASVAKSQGVPEIPARESIAVVPTAPKVPAAAWFPDPSGAGLRWWNGTAWTEHTHP